MNAQNIIKKPQHIIMDPHVAYNNELTVYNYVPIAHNLETIAYN